jgi:pimeloyl-ACP methyl ester carboxylesterase
MFPPVRLRRSRADGRITVDAGRYLATHIAGAKYVELPGTDHTFFGERDIADRIVDEIEEFLTGSHTASEPDRVLATVPVHGHC